MLANLRRLASSLRGPAGSSSSATAASDSGAPVLGSIEARPNPCITNPRTGFARTTLAWRTDGLASVSVTVEDADDGNEQVFSTSTRGSEVIDWIRRLPHLYTVRLYDTSDGAQALLDSVVIRAESTRAGANGSITASPNPCLISRPYRRGATSITWLCDSADAVVTVEDAFGGGENVFSAGSRGHELASWIEGAPHHYTFRLYASRGGAVIDAIIVYATTPPTRAVETASETDDDSETDRDSSTDERWRRQYQRWLARNAGQAATDEPLAYRPQVGFFMDGASGSARDVARTWASLAAQRYGNWQAWQLGCDETAAPLAQAASLDGDSRIEELGDGAEGWVAALGKSASDFVAWLPAGAELKPDALTKVVAALNAGPECDILYTDNDRRLADGSVGQPFFKPDWSPALLTSLDYVSGLAFCRRELLIEALNLGALEPGAIEYDLALRITELSDRIRHLASPLCTLPSPASANEKSREAAGRRALTKALDRRGQTGEVIAGRAAGSFRVRYDVVGEPKVTIIIPTRDKGALLRKCIQSVRAKSSYRNFEIMVIDNESTEAATVDYLSYFPGRVLRYPHAFNFARMMNLAAREADSEYVLFLNNDIEVGTRDWLEALLEQGQQPDVAVVGARLLYPSGHTDGIVHHEGITLGRHGVSVAHIRYDGYYGLGLVTREVSAVTGACYLTKRDLFLELGGFDERLKIGYNDVDFCLRAVEKGYRVIYTPHAELVHLTGATRGSSLPLKDEWFFVQRWSPPDYADPYFNPNLTQSWPVGIG